MVSIDSSLKNGNNYIIFARDSINYHDSGIYWN